jgi:hypothetical protein
LTNELAVYVIGSELSMEPSVKFNRIVRATLPVLFGLTAATAAVAGTGAFPQVVAPSATDDTAYSFSTTVTGGSGEVIWNYRLPGPGTYFAIFAANFEPAGSPSHPVVFACVIMGRDKKNLVESTATSTSTSGWEIGVSGSAIDNVEPGDREHSVGCGTRDNSTWSFADRPLVVTFIKLTGYEKHQLVQSQTASQAVTGAMH